MSVPLDNLYNWVEGLLPNPAVLYVFRPHGIKKISNLERLRKYNYKSIQEFPAIILHDQEPLDWDFYSNPQQFINHWKIHVSDTFNQFLLEYSSNFNLQATVFFSGSYVYDRCILIHSEKNSDDLLKYQQNGFLCVHYWAHAIIARDWFRFAEHDTRLIFHSTPQNKFLIHCRDWSHNREYRLKFLEMLIEHNLDKVSQTSVMHTNSEGVHFLQHQFKNSNFELNVPELINQIAPNNFASTSSADYNYADYVNAEVSVVLETVFDSCKIHLTEKTLRPIACGHPFLLAAGPGSLEYIKNYGFKTFSPWIDESYDLEIDSLTRLEKIIKSMKQIQNLTEFEKNKLKAIAKYNKEHFFSDEFFNIVKNELKTNLEAAYVLVEKTRGNHYLEILKITKKRKIEYPTHLRKPRTKIVRQLRQSYPRDQSNPLVDPPV